MATKYSAIERNKKPAGCIEIPNDFNCYYLNKKDRQMRFNNSADPIYAIFDKMEDRPLKNLVKDFFKELRDDSIKFVAKVVK